MKEYDIVGASYRKVRSSDIGVDEILNYVKSFGQKISILDLGCGNGFPIASNIFKYSNKYLGIDSSSVLLKEFEENLPKAKTYLCSMDKMEINNEVFDFVFAFGSIFHLRPESQIIALKKASMAVAPGGILFFSAWKEYGPCSGSVAGVKVPHWGLGEEAYINIPEQHGLVFNSFEIGSGGNGIFTFKAP